MRKLIPEFPNERQPTATIGNCTKGLLVPLATSAVTQRESCTGKKREIEADFALLSVSDCCQQLRDVNV